MAQIPTYPPLLSVPTGTLLLTATPSGGGNYVTNSVSVNVLFGGINFPTTINSNFTVNGGFTVNNGTSSVGNNYLSEQAGNATFNMTYWRPVGGGAAGRMDIWQFSAWNSVNADIVSAGFDVNLSNAVAGSETANYRWYTRQAGVYAERLEIGAGLFAVGVNDLGPGTSNFIGGGFGSVSNLNASAAIEVDSNTKGILFPRMTTTQKNAITSPAEGLVVYDTTLHKLFIRTAATWETITSS